MKYSKFLLAGWLTLAAMSASAQDETAQASAGLPDSPSTTAQTKAPSGGDYDHGYHLMPEIKLGSCDGVFGFGANLVLEHEFHRYFAWDIVSLDLSAPYDFSEGNIGLKTGLRYFTPRFAGGKLRGFVSAAVGYDCCIRDVVDSFDPDRVWQSEIDGKWHQGWYNLKKSGVSGFGLSAGIGLQIRKHVFLGYTMEYSTAIKFTSHYGKIGYRF